MSIPPLVCSTPPPPDQCEDDKYSEDFDSQYNLSQDDDDDDNYNYGDFSTFNNSHKSPEKQKPHSTATDTSTIHPEHIHNGTDDTRVHETSSPESNPSKIQVNIEDLQNLKLDEETLATTATVDQIDDLKGETDVSSIKISDNNFESKIPSMSHEIIEDKNNLNLNIPTILATKPLSANTNRIENQSIDITPTDSDNVFNAETKTLPKEIEDFDSNENITESDFKTHEQIDISLKEASATATDDKQDDDFGDFADFRFATISNDPSIIVDSNENPWSNTEAADDDFGEFKATTIQEESEEKNQLSETEKQAEHPKETDEIKENLEDSDDFGDFDEFKSSEIKSESVAESGEQKFRPVLLTFDDSESIEQISERINKIICTIFPEEIPKPKEELVNDLHTKLGKTWEYLLEVDKRQPYMVKWNNSVGQKYLLKALGIDARNILPTPKWSSAKPNYAANLSTAPLQPQKQASTQPEAVTQNKAETKSTWTDPFASEGQEAGAVSSSGDRPPIERPTDLDIFEASTSSKPDKVYSTTLNSPPIRQINLPDTHIFTPTDSETPRSKTIHYDSPTIPLPSTTSASASLPKKDLTSAVSALPTSADTDSEYWEFQDFQGPTTSSVSKDTRFQSEYMDPQPSTSGYVARPTLEPEPQPSTSGYSSTSATFGTQVLEPIKVEPSRPTLNWPEPGEVKETFDDFSEFISSSAGAGYQESPVISLTAPSNSEIVSDSTSVKTGTVHASDDEFDTFQSAPPQKTVLSGLDFNSLGSMNTSAPLPERKTTTSDYALPKSNQKKSNVISFSKSRPTYVPINPLVRSNKVDHIKSSPLQPLQPLTPTVLKPMPVTKSVKKTQDSSQILQPLSLESYSQINWPNPGIDLQDLSRFNPVETLNCLKSDLNTNTSSKNASPAHSQKPMKHQPDDDWGDFVSSKPQPQKPKTSADEDEWSDFVCSPSVDPQNGLSTISLNVHTNQHAQKLAHQGQFLNKTAQKPSDIPTLSYITPKTKTNKKKSYNDKHFQNL